MSESLAAFHPLVRAWFLDQVGSPTDVQRSAWPAIASGKHVLVTAPTGSGKTLAAFLWALDNLLCQRWPAGHAAVLYVSPLRALNNDVRTNLLLPLEQLRARFASASVAVPEIRVLSRSGDTPADERQRMLRRPPEIFITTPESLNILLTSRRGRQMLEGLKTVIIDEVHAVVDSKRGTHLITAIERLVPLCGEFQRIALSATVRPLDRVARWVGGFENLAPHAPEVGSRPRHVVIIESRQPKYYDLSVEYPGLDPSTQEPLGSFMWACLVDKLKSAMAGNRSHLIFANSRRMVEKLARLINEGESEQLAYAHHGSLSREIRAVVEARLKAGDVRAIVATNSLELGIDIGSLDQVLLVQTPATVASAVQRIGRAGHGVGQVSRGKLFPLVPRDILQAAAVSRAVLDGAIESVRPVVMPLDVLAQIVVSMTATQPWTVDQILALLRATDPYHELPRRQLELVIEMLAGRYADHRIRELRPLVVLDRTSGTVTGRPGSDRTVYLAGGTIPDRGYFHLRREDSLALVGELDEEFVWERAIGDAFSLGVQTWRITRITHNDVLVRPSRGAGAMAPFWRADARDRGFELAQRIGELIEQVEERLQEPELRAELAERYRLDSAAVEGLIDLLAKQKRATRLLPHRHRIVVEHVTGSLSSGSKNAVIVHFIAGGRVARAFAMALHAAMAERFGVAPEIMHDDDCLLINGPVQIQARELLSLVGPESLDRLLRVRLQQTGFFGALFRLAAGRALLLPRAGFRHRTPLWLSRLRAKKLLEAVSHYDDFPLVLETWRECLQDELDLPGLRMLLEEVQSGDIQVHEVVTDSPSPFAANVTWKQTNDLMYADDTPEGQVPTRVRQDLLRELVFASQLRPRIPAHIMAALQRKLHRLEPGWAPRSTQDLQDWLSERVMMPLGEWKELLDACERDHELQADSVAEQLGEQLVIVETKHLGAARSHICSRENLSRIIHALGLRRKDAVLSSLGGSAVKFPSARALADNEALDPAAELLADVLRYYVPVAVENLGDLVPLKPHDLAASLDVLSDSQRVILDQISEVAVTLEACDAENLERLLRAMRLEARPAFTALPVEWLAVFLAQQQGLGEGPSHVQELEDAVEKLFGYPLPAELWETEVLPARIHPYQPAWLDGLLGDTALEWFGCGAKRIAFSPGEERSLFVAGDQEHPDLTNIFPHPAARFRFEDLVRSADLSSADLTHRLWQMAWAGVVSNDSFAPVRQGIATDFKPAELAQPAQHGHRPSRRGIARWKASRPFGGSWYRCAPVVGAQDAVEQEELNRDRVRVLLDRWGVLFRELLERELPALQWGKVFRALRWMELSGEVLSGQFFDGIRGLQFASPAAFRRLRDGLDDDRVVWMCAADPACLCGLGLIEGLPRRLPTHHLTYHGRRLVVVSEARARRLDIRVPPDHPDLLRYLAFLDNLLTRTIEPERFIVIETICGESAATSPYRSVLTTRYHVNRDRTSLRLMREYRPSV